MAYGRQNEDSKRNSFHSVVPKPNSTPLFAMPPASCGLSIFDNTICKHYRKNGQNEPFKSTIEIAHIAPH